jgi:tRNA(Phe) wybutosine-synthesizing methylase Tyw3
VTNGKTEGKMIIRNIMPGEFDKEMMPLIEILNRFGIKTISSCSGHGKMDGCIVIDEKSIRMLMVENKRIYLHWHIPKDITTKLEFEE